MSRPVGETATTAAALAKPLPPSRYDGGEARLEVYLGAQKVVDSDGSWTAEVALRDGLFRLGGQLTRYYERQPDDSRIKVTLPSLIGGVRIDDRGPTQAFLEFGLVGVRTQGDPEMDSSVAGAVGGVRVEHRLTRHSMLTAEIHEMIFEDDIRAHSARVGLRSGPIQASFRILDFNVGPALYGPELGLRF